VATQAALVRARPFRLTTTNINAAPVDGTTQAHFVMAPLSTTGLQTTGVMLGLKAPTVNPATAVAAGFSVIMWILNPVTRAWFAASAVSVPYNTAFVTFDLDASALYFQIDVASVSVAGDIDFHVSEQ